MAKKLSSATTKTSKGKPCVCKNCEAACTREVKRESYEMYMGRSTNLVSTSYYCSDACLLSHERQEMGIDLRLRADEYAQRHAALKIQYMQMLIQGGDGICSDGSNAYHFTLSSLQFFKHMVIFIEAVLARKSAEELHLHRMKAKKYGGQALEICLTADGTNEAASCIANELQSTLADEDNNCITVFARN